MRENPLSFARAEIYDGGTRKDTVRIRCRDSCDLGPEGRLGLVKLRHDHSSEGKTSLTLRI